MPLDFDTTTLPDLPALTEPAGSMLLWVVSGGVDYKMTHDDLISGQPGGKTFEGGTLSGQTLTLKGTAADDGAILMNPSGGDVGVGVSIPDAGIHVSIGGSDSTLGGADTVALFQHTTATTSVAAVAIVSGNASGAESILQFGDTDAINRGQLRYLHGSDVLAIYTAATEVARFNSSGRLGVGATTIDELLHVESSSDPTKVKVETGAASGVAGVELLADSQRWTMRNNGAQSDAWQLRDETNSLTPIQVRPAAPSNTLFIDASGRIGISTASPATSAAVDITSTTGALLVPRMTTTQRNALTAANGMIIYNTTANQMQGRVNGAWVAL